MVMLALVVLGAFCRSACRWTSSQCRLPGGGGDRLSGAAPEIVESEITKRSRKASIPLPVSMPHVAQPLGPIGGSDRVRYMDGRKAADDAREGGLVKPNLRTEVKEPAYCVLIRPRGQSGPLRYYLSPAASSTPELTNWATRVLKQRLQNARGVGSVQLVGGTKRKSTFTSTPGADAQGITPDQVAPPCAPRTRMSP